ncbi:MAG: HesA/MoeB/ThiF family protein [Anaerolineales bacterium]
MEAVDSRKLSGVIGYKQVGQIDSKKLSYSSVMIVGCGSIGSVCANLLTRQGVGQICLIDNDRIEFTKLSMQELYNVDVARRNQFKVLAAKEHLELINPNVVIEPVIERLSMHNALRLVSGADLVLDGTDNDASRYAINHICHQLGIPWIFATILEWYGLMMNIIPGETPCFACAFGPSPISLENSARTKSNKVTAHLVATLMVSQALRILLGMEGYKRGLMYADALHLSLELIEIKSPKQGCPVCGRQDID